MSNPRAGPETASFGELLYNDLLTGAPVNVDPRLLESLPGAVVPGKARAVLSGSMLTIRTKTSVIKTGNKDHDQL